MSDMQVVLWRRSDGTDVARSVHLTERAAARATDKQCRRYPGASFRIEQHSLWLTSVFMLAVPQAILWLLVWGSVLAVLVALILWLM